MIGGFADIDTQAATTAYKQVKRAEFGLDTQEVLEAANALIQKYTFDGLLYGTAIESCPSLLEKIISFPVVGNSSETLQSCNNPQTFFPTLDRYSIPYPEISFEFDNSVPLDWLIKHQSSNGGIGVRLLENTSELLPDHYLQKKITGINFSITFLANEKDIFVLGFNTLWNENLGEDIPYAYAGSINQVDLSENVLELAKQYAQTITQEFGLVGLNSIDFICDDNSVYVLEVNPRIPATYELYETKYGNLLSEHIDACKHKNLPTGKKPYLLRAHAIVYAHSEITIPRKMSWPLWTADRPQAGEVISQYEPICSVFSGGKNSAQVRDMIKTRKQFIINKLI